MNGEDLERRNLEVKKLNDGGRLSKQFLLPLSAGLAKTILQDKVKVKEEEAYRRRDIIYKWTAVHFASKPRSAEIRTRWKETVPVICPEDLVTSWD